jgi:hypothetical protein
MYLQEDAKRTKVVKALGEALRIAESEPFFEAL